MFPQNSAKFPARKTICIPLMGGLGNQLFQLSAGLYLSNRFSRYVTYTPQFFQVALPSRLTQREFRIQSLLKSSEIVIWPKWKMGAALALSRMGHPSFIRELTSSDDSLLKSDSSLRFAIGFFQRDAFVSSVWDQLLDRMANSAEFATVLPSRPNESVVLHIRRGDYLAAGTRSFHGYTHLSYFEDAHMTISSIVGAKPLRVISDDIAGAQQQLSSSRYFRNIQITFENQTYDLESLTLMANARAVIASNSSFSWWGARLCISAGGYATVPQPWNASPSEADRFMHPNSDRWIILHRVIDN